MKISLICLFGMLLSLGCSHATPDVQTTPNDQSGITASDSLMDTQEALSSSKTKANTR